MGNPVADGTASFLGGQNAGVYPDRIGPNQFASGVNLTTIDGTLRPPPGRTEIPLTVVGNTFYTRKDGTKVPHAQILRSGKFQAAGDYETDTGKFIIAVISGIIFQIDPIKQTALVLDIETQQSFQVPGSDAIEPVTQRLDQYRSRIQWTQGGRFFVLYDAPDYPVLLEGGTVRRADPALYEIPANANLGAYNSSRLFVADTTSGFIAGDSTNNRATPNAPVTFSETLAPASPYLGQGFTLGSTNSNKEITAMGFLQQVDSITGIGPMFIATNESTYAYQADAARTDWEKIKFGTLILTKIGFASQRSFVNVGADIFFMDGEGYIRSFSVAQSDQKQWARTPIDKEVKNWNIFSDPELIPFTVAAYHNNRVLFSVNPFRAKAKDLDGNDVIDYACRGMVALELDNASGIGGQRGGSAPAWAGLWTGLYPMEMVKLDKQLYIFSKDNGSVNVLYRLESDDIRYDTVNGKPKQIISRVYTRDMNFASSQAMGLKENVAVVPVFKIIAGKFSCQVDKKSDQYPQWLEWRLFKHKAKTQRADYPYDKEMKSLAPHTLREINLGSPADNENACNLVTSEQLSCFNKMQLRLTITGKDWLLDQVVLKAEVKDDSGLINQACPEDNLKEIEVEEQDEISDWDIYSTALSDDEETCQ